MPLAQPPVAPTLSGDILSIHRLLQSPTYVLRRLRTLADDQFIADKLFTGGVEASGGAVAYEVSESRYTDRAPGSVAPGSAYPRAAANISTCAIATVQNWGQEVAVTDAAIKRLRQNAMDRSLTKAVNQVAKQVDTVALAAAGTAITQTQAAAFAWSTSTADPLLDVMLAQSIVEDLGEGYVADTVLVTKALYARLVANQKVISGLRREANTTVTEDGNVTMLGGLKVVAAPAARFPSGVTAMVLDSTQFGYLGYEVLGSPDFTGDPSTGIETRVRRDPEGADQYLITVRRPVVPIVQEPSSGVKITGA